ncbi:MAG: hypothetical protein ACP5LJ_02545 [Candidatus Bipolaricaulaceae bacterium]
MRVFFVFLWGSLGFLSFGATLDVPFDLARPAREWALFGVDLAIPDLSSNPGALAFSSFWKVASTFSSVFGAAQVWALSAEGKGLGGEVALLDGGEIGPNLRYRVWVGSFGAGLKIGSLGVGARARYFHPVWPKPSSGWALDLGLLWVGPVHLGVLAESVLSSSPYGEAWPFDFSLAAVWPWSLGNFSGILGAGMVDLLSFPTEALAVEIVLGPLSLRGGFWPSNLCLGGGLYLGWFGLDWAFTLHPDLPLGFRVSFVLRWP